jgi:sRNA-binding protein
MIDVNAIIAMLCEKFPHAFVMYEQRRRPLALGIHKEIAAAMPTLTKEQIKTAMRSYVANIAYLRACRAGAARVNLIMGHEVGVVMAAEADNSAARIAATKQWRAKRKAAAKEALAVARAAEIDAAARATANQNFAKPKLTLGSMRKAS